jgi:hemerythrin-like domain-containing protein
MTTPAANDQVDMTMMLVIHDALRRDLESIARAAAVTGDDPARLHATNFGWQLFKTFLTLHHTTEDAVLWPRMRELVAGRPDDLELLDAMEAEHARIEPLLAAVEAELADQEGGHARLGDATDALAAEVKAHLSHEERDALPLIGRNLSAAEWARFGEESRDRVGMDRAALYLPWLLDGARADRVENVMQNVPPHLQELYRNTWRPGYIEKNPWSVERQGV